MPLTVAVAVKTVEAGAAGVVAAGAGGVGVLPPLEPVELPQAATSIASKMTIVMGKARLKLVISFVFLLIRQIHQTRFLPECFC